MLPPQTGYERACGILKDLFGRPHEVARSKLDGLPDSMRTSWVDGDALCGLPVGIESHKALS